MVPRARHRRLRDATVVARPDTQPPWKGNKAAFKTLPLPGRRYNFQHGDLGAFNIMMDRHTLQIKALLGWEFAGFFPPGLERWPGTFDAAAFRERGAGGLLTSGIAELIPEEYLECCEAWEDKGELADLVIQGKLPDPHKVKMDLGIPELWMVPGGQRHLVRRTDPMWH